jgi:UDP-2-acetamido-3-amino-2,3-dideoxy-glucuronate N-acetyltransferase
MTNYFIHPSSFIDDNVVIEEKVKIWHFCHILSDTKIGQSSSLGQNCAIGPNVQIGSNVKIQNNVSVYDGVTIESDVFIGPSVVFTNILNPRSFIKRNKNFAKTHLQQGCSIGANATIVCGVNIGQYALIGAGSVINKNIPDFALYYGVPAKQHGWVSKAGNRLSFDNNNQATDPEDNSHYKLINEKVHQLT